MTVSDSSGNGNGGVLSGGVSWVGGVFGSALSFDGSSGQVKVSDNTALEPASTVTVSAWVKQTGTPGDYRYVLAKGANGCVAASYGLYTGPGGGLEFYVAQGRGSIYARSPDAGQSIWDGTWHLAVGTYDGSTIRLYVDGSQVGSGTAWSGNLEYLLPNSNDFYIGNYPGCSDHEFRGAVDDVMVWNRVLGASEIRGLEPAGDPPGQTSPPSGGGGSQGAGGGGTSGAGGSGGSGGSGARRHRRQWWRRRHWRIARHGRNRNRHQCQGAGAVGPWGEAVDRHGRDRHQRSPGLRRPARGVAHLHGVPGRARHRDAAALSEGRAAGRALRCGTPWHSPPGLQPLRGRRQRGPHRPGRAAERSAHPALLSPADPGQLPPRRHPASPRQGRQDRRASASSSSGPPSCTASASPAGRRHGDRARRYHRGEVVGGGRRRALTTISHGAAAASAPRQRRLEVVAEALDGGRPATPNERASAAKSGPTRSTPKGSSPASSWSKRSIP